MVTVDATQSDLKCNNVPKWKNNTVKGIRRRRWWRKARRLCPTWTISCGHLWYMYYASPGSTH